MRYLQLLLLFFVSSVFAQEDEYEHIISYHSDLVVQKNCDLLVTETIKVYADGNQINRGIFRDLPLSYLYNGGNVHVGFELLGIKRDGQSEPYHTEWLSNGIRIYIGDKDVYLNHGYYTYEIRYRVDHVLGFFKEYDELYWNVNGNGWNFTSDSISASVTFPEGAKLIQHDGYTGSFGSTNKDFTTRVEGNTVHYSNTVSFGPEENLTVAVAWEKGHLIYPTFMENVWFWIRSYILWFLGIIGLVVVIVYNSLIWYKYGRDPKPGTIIPRFYAPEGFSPAECVYLKKGGKNDKNMFGSQLIGLAVKGYITIDVKKENPKNPIYYVTENELSKAKEELNEIEKNFLSLLFGSKGFLIITDKFNARVKNALDELIASIDTLQDKKYFVRNSHLKAKQFILPILFLILGILASFYFGGAIGVVIVSFIFMLLVNLIFSRLYEQPTPEGRQRMDEIAGFEMYMKYADRLRIRAINPPTMDFTYFEKNLPYAIALGVATEWQNQFDVETIQDGYSTRMPYMHGMSLAYLSTFSEKMSSTISSASTPPSSSGSGSGGGGFSGGGGGGGGGGGW